MYNRLWNRWIDLRHYSVHFHFLHFGMYYIILGSWEACPQNFPINVKIEEPYNLTAPCAACTGTWWWARPTCGSWTGRTGGSAARPAPSCCSTSPPSCPGTRSVADCNRSTWRHVSGLVITSLCPARAGGRLLRAAAGHRAPGLRHLPGHRPGLGHRGRHQVCAQIGACWAVIGQV